MKQISGNGSCIFCGETCIPLYYWHKPCKVKYIKDNIKPRE